jgi:hypothetical protein
MRPVSPLQVDQYESMHLDLDEAVHHQAEAGGGFSKEAGEKLLALNAIVQPLAAICLELGDVALRHISDGLVQVSVEESIEEGRVM